MVRKQMPFSHSAWASRGWWVYIAALPHVSLGITHQGMHLQSPVKGNEKVGICVIWQTTMELGNVI